MNTKTCFKCNEVKPVSEFYKHSKMTDGYLGKCKACTKLDTRSNRINNRENYLANEKARNAKPERKAKKGEYRKAKRARQPEKYIAWNKVTNAVRDGRLTKKPCVVCGSENTEAHHHDYSKPLDVQWYCRKHHREVAHGINVSPL